MQFIKIKWVIMAVIAFTCISNAHAQVGNNKGLLDANSASEKKLLSVPHFSQKIVDSIISQRPFASPVALNKLLEKNLGKDQLEAAYEKVFVHVNLNKAPREELLLIPKVGKRMAHEFEEYRPYKALAQFRREIGKYVDKDEVARLEQYVFIPIDLNKASDEHILSIPGIGKKMLHEFKEYRPYKNIAQFRREIGKYVDDKTVKRYERYVFIK